MSDEHGDATPPPTKESNPDRALASRSPPDGSGNQLTDEQADFVHTLFSHNIPAPAIARVMERMVDRQVVPPGENIAGASGVNRANTTMTLAPPSYESLID